MARLAQFGYTSSDSRLGIDQIGGGKRRAACLALVAVGAGIVAMGTFAGHIPVGKELPRLRIIQLHRALLHELVGVVQPAEKFRCRTVVYLGCRT